MALAAGCLNGALRLHPEHPRPDTPGRTDPAGLVLEDSRVGTTLRFDVRPLALATLPFARGEDHEGAPPIDDAEALASWSTLVENVPMRVRVVPGEPTLDFDEEGALVSELTLRLAAVVVVPVRRRNRPPVLRSCGCDGGEWCGGATQAPLEAKVRLRTRFRSAERRFGLVSTTTAEVVHDDLSCALGETVEGVPLDALSELVGPLQPVADELASRVDEAVASAPLLRESVERFWVNLNEPVPFEAGQILLQPKAVGFGPFEGRPPHLRVPVWFTLRPRILPEGAEIEPTALPEAPAAEPRGEGFRIASAVKRSLTDAAGQLRPLLGNRYPSRGPRYVRIANARLYGSGGELVVHLQLDGSALGDIFLHGALVLDPDTARLTIEQLDFAPGSREALDILYDEIEQPDATIRRRRWFDPETLRRDVARRCVWDMRAAVESRRVALEAALRHDAPRSRYLAVQLTDVAIANVVVTADELRLDTVFLGELSLSRVNGEPSTPSESRLRVHPRQAPGGEPRDRREDEASVHPRTPPPT
ncbi:MAG: DUF4403 family protein [Myxococcales bacterium]|nr:DUF4403 family protein [Myxococcales bacterium]